MNASLKGVDDGSPKHHPPGEEQKLINNTPTTKDPCKSNPQTLHSSTESDRLAIAAIVEREDDGVSAAILERIVKEIKSLYQGSASEFHSPVPSPSSSSSSSPPSTGSSSILNTSSPDAIAYTAANIEKNHIFSIRNATPFHSRSPPLITVTKYLERLIRYAQLDIILLLTLLVYLHKYAAPLQLPAPLTIHRLILAAVVVSCKFLCDTYLTNAMYAKIGGVTMQELNGLEVAFLAMTGWNCRVSERELVYMYDRLQMDET